MPSGSKAWALRRCRMMAAAGFDARPGRVAGVSNSGGLAAAAGCG